MNGTADFLVEIGTEELPAQNLFQLSQDFSDKITKQLKRLQLQYENLETFVTPRRLAIIIKQLSTQPPNQIIERKGPSVSDAFDASGAPTQAALGFAKSCGVPLDSLEQRLFGKTKHLMFKKMQPSQKTIELLPKIIQTAIEQLPISRSMRWGDKSHSFLRPIRWLTMLLGNEIVPATLFGISAGRETYGHRFHHPQAISLNEPSEYAKVLENQGFVVSDFERRKNRIYEQVISASKNIGKPNIESDLLAEVTGLVEWPIALIGQFSETFLEVPEEVLRVTMKNHQRYFSVTSNTGTLLPYFVIVSNISSHNPQRIISGNERVLSARLSDAQFFYEQDIKQNFIERSLKLEKMIFEKTLGNLLQKVQRLELLAEWIAQTLQVNTEKAILAAILSKLDLTTELVNEFPELQGIMGYHYAKLAGYSEEISQAIKSHYQPRFSGDDVPNNLLGAIVALADKIDTLVGIFGIGQIPTGEKDPFALRRAALGILRILIEKALPIDLRNLIQESIKIYGENIKSEGVLESLFDFMMDRLKSWYLEQGIHANVFSAVLACQPTQPYEFHQRIQAVQAFLSLPVSKDLVMMNKRVDHLLKKQTLPQTSKGWQDTLLENKAERDLAQVIQHKTKQIKALKKDQSYTDMLSTLVELQPVIDQFFEQVMVLVDDEKIRQNRLGLLACLQDLFLEVADVSRL